ncbi:signal peptidase I . Serine peptidase. MEROPS family S26A [Enhydrobacter aerosaccus]|uniref:Signal peptidase I n=1 Tax=Enhydrobacter aerosaccus TaxID=225324 RepID=A0A1T4JZ71_9HYPH|nr:signal peptidase I . Serine peptidase. MEROPS family S26A [Enhydrobacter aerosaccus]
MTDVAERRKRQEKAGGWAETIRTVVYAVVIAIVVRTFVIEPFNIPSGSMIPTLLVGDYLFVSKFSYGYSKHSFPFSLGFFSGRIFFHPPHRGDVAVFKYPGDQGQGLNRTDYIKRIVGLPGDRIQVTNGVLHINGTPVQRVRIGDYVKGGYGGYQKGVLYRETLPDGGPSYTVLEYSDNGASDNTPEFLVPANSYFVMGDNRDDSLDSRTRLMLRDITGAQRDRDQLGWYVPAENLVGKAEFIFFSHDPSEAGWLEPWKWPEAIRFSRFFMAIH